MIKSEIRRRIHRNCCAKPQRSAPKARSPWGPQLRRSRNQSSEALQRLARTCRVQESKRAEVVRNDNLVCVINTPMNVGNIQRVQGRGELVRPEDEREHVLEGRVLKNAKGKSTSMSEKFLHVTKCKWPVIWIIGQSAQMTSARVTRLPKRKRQPWAPACRSYNPFPPWQRKC